MCITMKAMFITNLHKLITIKTKYVKRNNYLYATCFVLTKGTLSQDVVGYLG